MFTRFRLMETFGPLDSCIITDLLYFNTLLVETGELEKLNKHCDSIVKKTR